MGLIAPKSSSGAPPDPSDLSHGVTANPMGAPSGGPDAYTLSRNDFKARDLPQVIGTREARYQTVIKQSVLDDIHAHGKSSRHAEVCGVLIGDVYCDHLGPWAYIEHCIRGNGAVGKQTQVTITSETWTRIHETLEKNYPDKKIVGWYHTHPGFGIFLSGMDLFIQDNFFNQSWQLALVYDPHSGEEGLFVWRAGKSNRESFLVERDPEGTPANAAIKTQYERLLIRVRVLESRIHYLLTGALLLVLVALVAPMVIYAMGPETMKHFPMLYRLLGPDSPPARVAPTTAPATAPTSRPADGVSLIEPGFGAAPEASAYQNPPPLLRADADSDEASGLMTKAPPIRVN